MTPPPSEPFGLLLPSVRAEAGAGSGLRHEATRTTPTTGPGAPVGDDPVDQVLADEAATVGDTIEHHHLDLGQVAAGTLELEVRSAVAGTVIDNAAAEHLDGGGLRRLSDPGAAGLE